MNLRHEGVRDARVLQECLVPCAVREMVEHRARSVRVIRRMHLAARELPQKPAVDRAEGEVSIFRQLACAGHVVEEPADLADGEIRREHHRRILAELFQEIGVLAEALDNLLRLHRLPADGVVDRSPRMAIPDHRRLTLIRDADRRDLRLFDARLANRLLRRLNLYRPDLVRILLDPAGLRVIDAQFLLHEGDQICPLIKNRRAVLYRTRIECKDVSPAHRKSPLPYDAATDIIS